MASNLREFLQLAQTFDMTQNVAGWFASIKLDGWRAFWDGGITRGMLCTDIPWANTAKDARYVTIPKATGLWSRYGKPIQAPDWWLDRLPGIPMDGELWGGHGSFQKVMSTTKQLIPGAGWEEVTYRIFDLPSYREVFADGEIRNKGKYEKKFDNILNWILPRLPESLPQSCIRGGRTFEITVQLLKQLAANETVIPLHQELLPYSVNAAKTRAVEMAEAEVQMGGEGIMVRMGNSFWVPKRVRTMLKVKPSQDAEGTVIGYIWGEETALGSKLLGKMGSVLVEWKGKRFNLSGFTDEERKMGSRTLSGAEVFGIGCDHPGKQVSSEIENFLFPRGSQITFTYRSLTDAGLPKEARFLRSRPDE